MTRLRRRWREGWAELAESQADGAFGGGGVDGVAVLCDVEEALGGETAGGGAGGFHEGLPVGLSEGLDGRVGGLGGDGAGGFGGADGFVRAAELEEAEDFGFEGEIGPQVSPLRRR